MSKILLADDDRTFGVVLRNELEREGHTVTLVTDGVEAVIEVLTDFMHNNSAYGLVLLDIRMPHLDGINALRIIKKLNPRLPAITFSGNAGNGEMAESVKAGALRCLTKPFSIPQLKAEINKHVSRSGGIYT